MNASKHLDLSPITWMRLLKLVYPTTLMQIISSHHQ